MDVDDTDTTSQSTDENKDSVICKDNNNFNGHLGGKKLPYSANCTINLTDSAVSDDFETSRVSKRKSSDDDEREDAVKPPSKKLITRKQIVYSDDDDSDADQQTDIVNSGDKKNNDGTCKKNLIDS